MADILAIWTWENYLVDTSSGLSLIYEYNSSQEQFYDLPKKGDSCWLITSRRVSGQTLWHLLAELVVIEKLRNQDDDRFYHYGTYKLRGDRERSR